VQASVAGAVGVDAQREPVGEQIGAGLDGGRGGVGVRAVDRDVPELSKKAGNVPGPQAGLGEVFGLGEVEDLAAGGHGSEHLVGGREMIRRDDCRSAARHMLLAGYLWPEVRPNPIGTS
jgi:hypothetical protein